jgi:hypothetical protein
MRRDHRIVQPRNLIAKPARKASLREVAPTMLVNAPVEQIVLNLFGQHVSIRPSSSGYELRVRRSHLVTELVEVSEHLERIVQMRDVRLLLEADQREANLAQEAQNLTVEHCRSPLSAESKA